jgi:hypothetical protein
MAHLAIYIDQISAVIGLANVNLIPHVSAFLSVRIRVPFTATWTLWTLGARAFSSRTLAPDRLYAGADATHTECGHGMIGRGPVSADTLFVETLDLE